MFLNPGLEVPGYTNVRGTRADDGAIVFEGGTIPQAMLELSTPIEAGRTYSFSAVAENVDGALYFLPPGGGASEIGAEPIRFTAAEGGSQIALRGNTGSTGRLSGFVLED